MKKKNVGLIITTAIISIVVAATIGIAIFAGVAAIFADGGEETTAAQTEQVKGEDTTGSATDGTNASTGNTTESGDKNETTASGDNDETTGSAAGNETEAPVVTTTAAEQFEETETIVLPEIPEED